MPERPLLREPAERLTQKGPAHAELLREVDLVDALAGREAAIDDHVTQLDGHGVADVIADYRAGFGSHANNLQPGNDTVTVRQRLYTVYCIQYPLDAWLRPAEILPDERAGGEAESGSCMV